MTLFSAEVAVGENPDSLVRLSEVNVGGIDPGSSSGSTVPGFNGSLQQFAFNGEDIFELARSGQLTNHQVSFLWCKRSAIENYANDSIRF